jgi:integrase
MNLSDKFHEKLAKTGLIEPRRQTTLSKFINPYIEDKAKNTETTRANKRISAKTLYRFFGEDRNPETITEKEVQEYVEWLPKHQIRKDGVIEVSVKPGTVATRLQHVTEFFRAMLDDKFISHDPFGSVKYSNECDSSKKIYIPAEDIYRVMKFAPDTEWRLIIALWRFGGLRRSSEVLRLKWEHVLWDQGKIIVPSSKTAHHGKSMRTIPIFHELSAPLRDCQVDAGKGAVYVIEKHCPRMMKMSEERKVGNHAANLIEPFNKIVESAGLKPWPMPGHNLRASLVTDLYDGKYPNIGIHTIAQWLGHSPAVALKHYGRVKEAEYEKARNNPEENTPKNKKRSKNKKSSKAHHDSPEKARTTRKAGKKPK